MPRFLPLILLIGFVAVRPIAADELKQHFEQGERALARGDLAQADAAFRQVLALNPNDVGAHANLGVIAMRRRQWTSALAELKAAEKLAPGVPGIRLNIGLGVLPAKRLRSGHPSI